MMLIPISWQFNDIMLNTFLFVNTTLHKKIIKAGEAPLQGAAVLQSGDFHKSTRETHCPESLVRQLTLRIFVLTEFSDHPYRYLLNAAR